MFLLTRFFLTSDKLKTLQYSNTPRILLEYSNYTTWTSYVPAPSQRGYPRTLSYRTVTTLRCSRVSYAHILTGVLLYAMDKCTGTTSRRPSPEMCTLATRPNIINPSPKMNTNRYSIDFNVNGRVRARPVGGKSARPTTARKPVQAGRYPSGFVLRSVTHGDPC